MRDSRPNRERGRQYVAGKLAAMRLHGALDDGRIALRVSAGRNNSRAWYAGKQAHDNGPVRFYVFVNAWDDPSRPIECFVVPADVVRNEVRYERPQFTLRGNAEDMYRDRWDLLQG